MQTHSRDTSILSKGWIYLLAIAVVSIVFGCIFVYITLYDSQDGMMLSYASLIYAVYILYLMIIISAYYLKVMKPMELIADIRKLRSTISDAYYRPRY